MGLQLFEGWEDYATERQQEVLNAWISEGSASKAAEKLSIRKSSVLKTKKSVMAKAAKSRLTPQDLALQASPGYGFKRKSLYFKEGEITNGWLIQEPDAEQQAAQIREFIEGLAETLQGVIDPKPAPADLGTDYLSCYVLGDAHIGMYAWGEETGSDDYDSDIAMRHIKTAVDYLVSCAPASEEALLIDVGDLMHFDDTSQQTFKGKNQLDTDTRFSRVIRIAAFVVRYAIESMLTKHHTVHVINARGNHNPHTSTAINMALSMLYEREPRVVIHNNTAFFQYMEFGNNLLGVVHGDTAKPAALPGIMADDQDDAWGRCKNRYWFRGHVHHNDRKEFGSCTVESFNTLAPKDAWHTEQGYRAKRSMHFVGIHRKHGIMPRIECPITLVKELCE